MTIPAVPYLCKNLSHMTLIVYKQCWQQCWLLRLHTHTQLFNGLWSGTTRYQKKHSPTHTHPDHWTSFIIFLHLQRSMASLYWDYITHTHPFNGPFPGLPGWAGTRKVKPIWTLLKQETVSGISWAICKSEPRSRQITTPAPHRSVFLQAGCPSCHPTNSVKALRLHKWFLINH